MVANETILPMAAVITMPDSPQAWRRFAARRICFQGSELERVPPHPTFG
jgi:hypothetical protein